MASGWDELERWMERQQLPKGFEMLKEPDWVEKFVRNMMTKALPEAAGAIVHSSAAEVTEGKRYLRVKLALSPGAETGDIRLFLREDLLRIEGLPGGKPRNVKLPKRVNPRYCRAAVRDGSLLVRLEKRPGGGRWHEHGIARS